MSNNIFNECLNYFKQNEYFKNLMNKAREKYIKSGSLRGSIILNNLSYDEKEALSGFFSKDLYNIEPIQVKISDITKVLQNSKFKCVDFEKLLFAYYNENIISEKDKKLKYETDRNNFFECLLSSSIGNIKSFLEDAFENKLKGTYKLLIHRYDEDKTTLPDEINNLYELSIDINKGHKDIMPILAANITKNPHGLDEGTFLNQLLTYYLCYIKNCEYPNNSEEKNILFYKNNILKDDLLNYTIICGFDAYIDDNSSQNHDGFSGFNKYFEPHIVNVRNISSIKKILPLFGEVYILENPSVFSHYIYEMQNKIRPYSSLICSNGQINYSSYLFLDLLIEQDVKLYYWGDFDPEGLLIADRLSQRYKNKIEFYNYTIEKYYKSLSNEPISTIRLSQLKNLKSETLIEIANEMLKIKKSGYQERLLM